MMGIIDEERLNDSIAAKILLKMTVLIKSLPKRNSSSNKAKAGRSLIIAGSDGMFGAAVLSAKAAARVGSGYVQLLTDLKKFPTHKHPDFLIADIKNSKLKKLKFNALAIGPGLGHSLRSQKILNQVLKLEFQRIIFDADALNLLAKRKNIKLKKSWILTPHEGELARLLKRPVAWVQKNRKKATLEAQKKFDCIVVLKGHHTLIADSKKVYVNTSGNSALAKAGTGDVLTGMICGFMAQGLDSMTAARLAVYVHGLMADEWIKKNDALSLMASDLIDMLPKTLKKLRIA